MTALHQSDRLDGLGLKALDDPHATPTLEQVARSRATDRELICLVIDRLERAEPGAAARIGRFSPAELTILARLERAAT